MSAPRHRVLMLSKALVVGAYQRKAELIAAEPDIELTVAVPPLWRDGDLVRRLERVHLEGYRLIETPIARPGDFHLHFYPRFGGVLDAVRPDLVHIDEEPYNLASFLAMAVARRRGARTVFFTWQNLNRGYPPPFRWFERAVYRWAGGAIAGSHTAADVLRAKGYTGRIWVIPQFGVDPAVYRPPDRRAEGPLRVAFAGRLVPAKGVDLLIEALARLAGVDWTLQVVGEGQERARLAALAAARGIGDRVAFRAWLPSAEMPAFYRSLDVLVLPSRATPTWIEQFGRVLTEAMACGVACIGSDCGEIPHVLGDAGLVFPDGDAGALAGALALLAADAPLRARLGAAGRSRVLACFTMVRVAAETAAAYREILRPST